MSFSDLQHLLKALLAYKPKNRMSDWSKVINHPWMLSKDIESDAIYIADHDDKPDSNTDFTEIVTQATGK